MPRAPRPRRRGLTLLEGVVVFVLTSVFLWWILREGLRLYFRTTNVRPGVRFLGVEVGGLSRETLEERLEDIVAGAFRDPILLRQGQAFHIAHYRDHYRIRIDTEGLVRRAEALGRDLDLWTRALQYLRADFPPVELPWKPELERPYTREALSRVLGDEVSSRKTYAFAQDDGSVRVVVTAGEDQLESLLDRLEQEIQENPLATRKEVEIPEVLDRGHEVVLDPEDPVAGFTHELAVVHSPFEDPERERLVNIARLLSRVHGRLLNPGEVFRLSAAAGPLTTETGYVVGTSVDGTAVTTRVGYGLDQAAAALKEALVRAGAQLVRHDVHEHFTRELAGYTSPGWDVDLEGGGDLVVENPWSYPMRITGALSPDELQVDVRALEPPEATVEIRVGVPEKVPYKTELIQDPYLPRGVERVEREGLDGFRVKIFRKVLYGEGREGREQVLGGKPLDYAPRPSRIRIGTGDPEALRRHLPRDGEPTPLSAWESFRQPFEVQEEEDDGDEGWAPEPDTDAARPPDLRAPPPPESGGFDLGWSLGP